MLAERQIKNSKPYQKTHLRKPKVHRCSKLHAISPCLVIWSANYTADLIDFICLTVDSTGNPSQKTKHPNWPGSTSKAWAYGSRSNQAKYKNLSVGYITCDFPPQKGTTKTDYQEFKSSSTNIAKDLLSMPVRAEKYLSLTTETVLQYIWLIKIYSDQLYVNCNVQEQIPKIPCTREKWT